MHLEQTDPSCSLSLPLLTAPPASLLLELALALICMYQPNNLPFRSGILVTAQIGKAKVQVACRTRSGLGAWGSLCVCGASPWAMGRGGRPVPHCSSPRDTGLLPPLQPLIFTCTHPSLRPLKADAGLNLYIWRSQLTDISGGKK